MNEADRKPFGRALVMHFPHLATGDAVLCWDACRVYPLALVASAIASHRLQLGERAYRPDATAIARICRDAERAAAGAGTSWAERTRDYEAGLKRAGAEQAGVEARVAALTDAELAEAKRAVLDTLAPASREIFEPLDPRGSLWLRNAIVAHLNRRPEAAGKGTA